MKPLGPVAQVASDAATRPDQHRTQQTNILLNDLDAALGSVHHARTRAALTTRDCAEALKARIAKCAEDLSKLGVTA